MLSSQAASLPNLCNRTLPVQANPSPRWDKPYARRQLLIHFIYASDLALPLNLDAEEQIT